MINYTSSQLRNNGNNFYLPQREDKLWEMHEKVQKEDIPFSPKVKDTKYRIKFEGRIYPISMTRISDIKVEMFIVIRVENDDILLPYWEYLEVN